MIILKVLEHVYFFFPWYLNKQYMNIDTEDQESYPSRTEWRLLNDRDEAPAPHLILKG